MSSLVARAFGLTVVLAMALAACAATPAGPTDLAASPTPTDPFLRPHGDDATGPVEELGSGTAFDTDWRLGIYPTADGWCTQLSVVGLLGARCGDLEPEPDAVFRSVATQTSEATGATVVDGIVSEQTATVWLVAANQQRVPAVLVSLGDQGVEGQAFVGLMPPGLEATHLQAVALNGAILETIELP
jgi:hypothetical protein